MAAPCPGLDQDVADGGGFDRSGQHRRPQRSAISWQSRAFWHAAADQVDDTDRLAAEPFGVVEGLGIGDGQALQDAP